MSKQRLRTIIEKILAGKATPEEIAEITSAIEQDHVSQLVEDIHDLLSVPEDEGIVYDEKKWDAISARILKADEVVKPTPFSARVVRLIKKIAIGAVVFIAVAPGICYPVGRNTKTRLACTDGNVGKKFDIEITRDTDVSNVYKTGEVNAVFMSNSKKTKLT